MTAQSAGTFKGLEAEYTRTVFSGKNTSGFIPLAKSVLVLPDLTTRKTSGGIHMIDELVDRANLGSETGVIVAVGEEAFSHYSNGRPWTGYKPVPGDRIVFEKYAGRMFQGRDGQIYRLMDYPCVGALEEPEEALETTKPKSKKA